MTIRLFQTALALLVAFTLVQAVHAQDGQRRARIESLDHVAAAIPEHGTASIKPADTQEQASFSGNGRMGALVFGRPDFETLILNRGDRFSSTNAASPGLTLRLNLPLTGEVASDYLRTENVRTGEVTVCWRDGEVSYARRLFVSRPDNLIVMRITADHRNSISFRLSLGEIAGQPNQPTSVFEPGWITSHNVHQHEAGGFDAVVRVIPEGG
ncbi:MAG: glycoside hydrolase N-terminal domain-containing protein, partial [Akkermansiaceae bacterium]|nr:glycoside hydrolase N-terminal domain-containing protein [Verrucomicrobiales bacterium]